MLEPGEEIQTSPPVDSSNRDGTDEILWSIASLTLSWDPDVGATWCSGGDASAAPHSADTTLSWGAGEYA